MIEFYPAGCKLNPPDASFQSWIYFHRELNDIIESQWKAHPERSAPDLVDSVTDVRTLEKGLYDCLVQGMVCKLILWYAPIGSDLTRKIARGYIMTKREFDQIWNEPDCFEREKYEKEVSCI